MSTPSAAGFPVHRTCPCCGSSTRRVRRRPMDRVISLWRPVVRYRCESPTCGWQGRVPGAVATADGRGDGAYRPHQVLDPALGGLGSRPVPPA